MIVVANALSPIGAEKELESKQNIQPTLFLQMAEYIELAAAMRAILGEPTDAHYPGWYAAILMELPAADVAPVVHGRWIKYLRAQYFRCSECKYTMPYKKAMLVNKTRQYNYCPHCGAKMDGGDNDATD